jgi:hypothetical protein
LSEHRHRRLYRFPSFSAGTCCIAHIASHTLRHYADPIHTNRTYAHFVSTIIPRVYHHTKPYPISVMDIKSPWFTDGPCTSLGTSSVQAEINPDRFDPICSPGIYVPATTYKSWTKRLALSSHPHGHPIGRIREVTSRRLPYSHTSHLSRCFQSCSRKQGRRAVSP